MRLSNHRKYLQKKIDNLSRENQKLYDIYEKYKKGDYNIEEAQRHGFFNKNSKVIFFENNNRNNDKENIITKRAEEQDFIYKFNIEHLRVLWVCISLIIILFYFIKRRSLADE